MNDLVYKCKRYVDDSLENIILNNRLVYDIKKKDNLFCLIDFNLSNSLGEN